MSWWRFHIFFLQASRQASLFFCLSYEGAHFSIIPWIGALLSGDLSGSFEYLKTLRGADPDLYPQEQQGGRSVQRSRSDWTQPLLTDTVTDPTRGLSSPANDICDGERAETRSRTEFDKHRSSLSLNLAISSEFLEHYGLRTQTICPQLAWSWGVFTCCKQPANDEKGTNFTHSLDCWLSRLRLERFKTTALKLTK